MEIVKKAVKTKETEDELKACRQLLDKYEKLMKDSGILPEQMKRKSSLIQQTASATPTSTAASNISSVSK